VAALADEALGDAGHRLVVVLDDAAGERLSPGLAERGFEQRRTLYMALRGDPTRALRDPRVRELGEPELDALQRAVFEDDNVGPHTTPQLPGLLADGQAALRAAGIARGFGAGQGGELQSTAMLFLDPDVDGRRTAMVEQVGTLRSHRRQGLARATVSAALLAAGEWGAELIVIPTDAEDWPQLLYASLGFAPIGRVWAFTRHDRGVSPPGSGSAPAGG
jgi:GNAT superfamily N-acetyltransferase